MASLGPAVLGTLPTPAVVTAYSPAVGGPLGSAVLLNLSGSGSTPVIPKKYLNVGGTAVPIQ